MCIHINRLSSLLACLEQDMMLLEHVTRISYPLPFPHDDHHAAPPPKTLQTKQVNEKIKLADENIWLHLSYLLY